MLTQQEGKTKLEETFNSMSRYQLLVFLEGLLDSDFADTVGHKALITMVSNVVIKKSEEK